MADMYYDNGYPYSYNLGRPSAPSGGGRSYASGGAGGFDTSNSVNRYNNSYDFDVDPYMDLLKTGAGAYGAYRGERERQKMLEPASGAYQDYLEEYTALMKDPRSVYMKDPSVLQARQQRMRDVQAGQLSRTGGTRGGAYGRQLAREGQAFDQAVLAQKADMLRSGMDATAPAYSAAVDSGGASGAKWDAVASVAPTIIDIVADMDW